MATTFKQYLENANLAPNTVGIYTWTIHHFLTRYEQFTATNLLDYKVFLMEHFNPKTVNLRIQALNKYLDYSKQNHLRLKSIKVQQPNFIDNVISNADYLYLKNKLKEDGYIKWYFMVWLMTATGARVSELTKIKVEHLVTGYIYIYSKGGKIRRLYIPQTLKDEALVWIDWENINSGFLFLNRFGKPITARGIAQQLQYFALRYGISKQVMHPHSFRHRFAKNFLERHNDLALLADLMGHESIETTRIYLRHTASEQQQIINKVVNW